MRSKQLVLTNPPACARCDFTVLVAVWRAFNRLVLRAPGKWPKTGTFCGVFGAKCASPVLGRPLLGALNFGRVACALHGGETGLGEAVAALELFLGNQFLRSKLIKRIAVCLKPLPMETQHFTRCN